MLINGVKAWWRDKVNSHLAAKFARIGQLALGVKIAIAAVIVFVVVALVGGVIVTAVATVTYPVNAIASFLHLPSPFEDDDDGTSERTSDAPQCLTGEADESFSDLVSEVPQGTSLDVATGWLIYAAPHQAGGRRTAASTLEFDEFEQSWSEVITGTYSGPPARTSSPPSRPSPSRGSSTATTSSEPPATILGVVEAIDPDTDYHDYVEQAYVGAIYLLASNRLAEPPEDVRGDLIGGMAQACAEGGDIPTPPLLGHSGGN